MKKLMKSVQMYTLRDYMTDRESLLETLNKVAGLGYDGVQTQLPAFISPEEYAAELAARGLYADSISSPLLEVIGNRDGLARLCSIFGIDVVRVNGMPEGTSNSKEGFMSFAEQLQQAADSLSQLGIRLMYHNHHGEFTMFCDPKTGENVCGMDIVVKNTRSNVLFQPDIHHIHYAGFDIAETLKKYFDRRAVYIHMQGYGFRPGDSEPYTMPVGLGTYDWKEVTRAALDIGVYNFVAEQDWCLGDPFTDLAFSKRSLDLLLGC